MKKRMVAMAMAAAMAFTCLSGCGNAASGTETSAVLSATSAAVGADTGDPGSADLAKPKGNVLVAAIADQEHEDRLGLVQPIANNDAMRGIMPGIENLFHYNNGKVEGC